MCSMMFLVYDNTNQSDADIALMIMKTRDIQAELQQDAIGQQYVLARYNSKGICFAISSI